MAATRALFEKQKTEGYIVLERASGLATIPLSGIDAPFHPCYPWPGVMPFHAYLSKRFAPIFRTLHLSMASISPHHPSLSIRLMSSSFTTAHCRRVSRRSFTSGTKNVGTPLDSARSLHGSSSSNCYHTSSHPPCAGSKHRIYSSRNTSSNAS